MRNATNSYIRLFNVTTTETDEDRTALAILFPRLRRVERVQQSDDGGEFTSLHEYFEHLRHIPTHLTNRRMNELLEEGRIPMSWLADTGFVFNLINHPSSLHFYLDRCPPELWSVEAWKIINQCATLKRTRFPTAFGKIARLWRRYVENIPHGSRLRLEDYVYQSLYLFYARIPISGRVFQQT